MAGDLLIKNGTVVDGTGAPSYRGDVGIKDGKFVDPASMDNGARVIDAEGKVVAPGFVDIHTHYDAQIMWDPLLTCSPWHGVTTVIMGNCGFSLAPCLPKDREYILKMFARVEGMNVNTLQKGLDWRWQSFPEYLDRVQQENLGINVGTMVGHSAVRRFVMGEDSNTRAADADEVQQMKVQVREGLAAGAFGFSTSLSATHYGWDGEPVPSRLASHDEVLELGSTLREFGVGSIEIITKTSVMGPDRFEPEDEELMTALSLRSGRPVNWNELSHSWQRPTAWKNQIDYMERAAKQGAQVYAVARCQRLDHLFNLAMLVPFFEAWPTWKDVLSQPRERVKQLLQDPETRAKMKREAHEADPGLAEYRKLAKINFRMGKSGKYSQYEGMSLGEIGQKIGKDPVDVILDFSLEEDLEAEFAFIGTRNGDMNAVAELIQSPYSLAGLSDAGAHTDRLSGSYFSSFMLSHWVRDQGVLLLEDAIRRLTSMPASLYGITDKGRIQEGLSGDVVIFDLDKIKWMPTERFHDFPGGESRLGNRAEGYEHLIVDGEVVFEDGRHTGALPGRLIKSTEYARNGDFTSFVSWSAGQHAVDFHDGTRYTENLT